MDYDCIFMTMSQPPTARPGQNILPIIQIFYSQYISLLFNLISPIIQIIVHYNHWYKKENDRHYNIQ